MTEILVDTSSWIHFFRQSSLEQRNWVSHALREDRVVTCGLVITEIMQGARSEKERKNLWQHFDLLRCVELNKNDYREAAAMGSDLRHKGIIIKTVDLLIAHLAIRDKLSLLQDDSDFKFISRHFPLVLENA